MNIPAFGFGVLIAQADPESQGQSTSFWVLIALLLLSWIALGFLAAARKWRVVAADPDGAKRTIFSFKTVMVFVGAALLLVFGAGWLTWYFNSKSGANDELQMSVMVVAAIVALMTILFILAAGFKSMELTEEKQPLGLPEGSIRAMIALVLIMVFIIFGIYLFRIIGQGGAYAYVDQLDKEPDKAVLEKWERLSGRPAQYWRDGSGKFYYIYAWQPTSDEAKRLAQQLITTVGTLVVAVAGFYFGSSSTSSAVKQGREDITTTQDTAKPEITQVTQGEGKKGESVPLTITGKNFKSPKSVHLLRGVERMTANIISSTATEITCRVTLDKEPDGKWDLIVENGDGKEARLDRVFAIKA